jgi:acyl-coenzyme A thioesterase PaaI-like protein
MRLTYSTQSDAQTRADSIHAAMIATDADYAASAAANQTMRWAIPYQDKDDAGNLLSTNWFVTVSDRCQLVLTDAEQTAAGFPAPGP